MKLDFLQLGSPPAFTTCLKERLDGTWANSGEIVPYFEMVLDLDC